MIPSAMSERYANDSAMPSESQRTPSMQGRPPSAYCQRCTYSCAASSVRSVSGAHVSGAAACGAAHALFDVTTS